MDLLHTDILIIGSGVAGLYAALQFPRERRVTMLCKREMGLSNSSLAQGGVAAVLDRLNDSPELHYNDTMIAGGQKNNPAAVQVLVNEGPDDVRRLMEWGVDFDKTDTGEPMKTLEGGHSRCRIVHHKDSTGKAIVDALSQRVKAAGNISVREWAMVSQLHRATGGMVADVLEKGHVYQIAAPYVILATGGIGRVYQFTTNSAIATGDGIRMAYEIGAAIKHLDYIQFHPTAFAAAAGRERFLISEAVRGEGAYLLNCRQERFMHRYDERLELAPRDVVSHSIMMEYRKTGSDRFYLDITYKDPAFVKSRFPMIYDRCLREGVDITKDLIPVFPCQHYLMGGIDVDLHSRTTIDRLYAAGECSHTGVHGANRLASNSLLEALVFGRRAAQDIMSRGGFAPLTGNPPPIERNGPPLPGGMRTAVRDIMQRAHFVIPDQGAAEKGLKQVEEIRRRLYGTRFALTSEYCEAKSLATAACLILREAVQI